MLARLYQTVAYGGPGSIAVCFMGETFRTNAHTSDRGISEAGFENQKLATASHIRYVYTPLLIDLGYAWVDTHIYTEPSKFQDHLVAWYGHISRNVYSTFAKTAYDNGNAPIPLGFFNNWDYDAVILLRPDLTSFPHF